MKNYVFPLVFVCFLGLSSCATQPDNSAKGGIENEPPLSIDDPQKAGNNWIWLDGSNRWLYRDTPPVVAEPANWDFDAQAISLRFSSPQQLNMYMGKPHSLYIKVFQLSDVKVFQDIAKTPAGIRELLTSEDIDSTILGSSSLTIAPNRQENLVLDRFKETRFVALVTGYYQMEPKESIRIFKIPSVQNRLEETTFGLDDINPFSDPGVSEAARIKSWVSLGVTKISRVHMLAE